MSFSKRNFKRIFQLIKEYCLKVLDHPLFQIPFAVILAIPFIVTIGQYMDTGFFLKSTSVLLVFWPGIEGKISPSLPVWLTMGIMLLSFAAGVTYLTYKKNLGKVIIIGVSISLVSVALASVLNSLAGWHEAQDISQMDLTSKANQAIFSLWHNPAWEEIVFRGIPLVIISFIISGKNKRISFWAKAGYLVIPSLFFAFYHVPNHGPARMVDTFIAGLAFAWLALKFSFFAPLVLHYFFDTNMIQNLGIVTSIPTSEIKWLVNNHGLFNNIFSISIISILALFSLLLLRQIIKDRKRRLYQQLKT